MGGYEFIEYSTAESNPIFSAGQTDFADMYRQILDCTTTTDGSHFVIFRPSHDSGASNLSLNFVNHDDILQIGYGEYHIDRPAARRTKTISSSAEYSLEQGLLTYPYFILDHELFTGTVEINYCAFNTLDSSFYICTELQEIPVSNGRIPQNTRLPYIGTDYRMSLSVNKYI